MKEGRERLCGDQIVHGDLGGATPSQVAPIWLCEGTCKVCYCCCAPLNDLVKDNLVHRYMRVRQCGGSPRGTSAGLLPWPGVPLQARMERRLTVGVARQVLQPLVNRGYLKCFVAFFAAGLMNGEVIFLEGRARRRQHVGS